MIDVVHAGFGPDVPDHGTRVVRYEIPETAAEPNVVEFLGNVAHEHVAVLVHQLMESPR